MFPNASAGPTENKSTIKSAIPVTKLVIEFPINLKVETKLILSSPSAFVRAPPKNFLSMNAMHPMNMMY